MVHFVTFGSKQIRFHLSLSNRKSLGITVTPELDVLVIAPINSPIEKIKEKILKKAAWIIKQQSFFLSFEPKTSLRKYVSGETHLYLGRQYRLKVIVAKKNFVHFNGRIIEIYVKPKSKAKDVLGHWYKQKAKEKFAEIAEPLILKFKKYKVEPESLNIQSMPTRWGSCTPKGKIILNPELIKAPKPCIEYVIAHELCHLIHHDHTKKFMDLQTKEMSDWEKWKSKLEMILA